MASPHPPVVELSLLQQVLVASKAFFLIADPAVDHTGSLSGVYNRGHSCLTRKKPPSHSSQDFQGRDVVHENILLPVCSGHEISHVGGYGPRFPSEVRLLVDHNLETKDSCCIVGQVEILVCVTYATVELPLVHSCFPPLVPPVTEHKQT